MYIDFKIALWERIKIPRELEKDFKQKVLEGKIVSTEEAIKYLQDKIEIRPTKLSDTIEMVKTENNYGEATFQLFDKHHNLLFSNDDVDSVPSVFSTKEINHE